jgi:hypothetical protein
MVHELNLGPTKYSVLKNGTFVKYYYYYYYLIFVMFKRSVVAESDTRTKGLDPFAHVARDSSSIHGNICSGPTKIIKLIFLLYKSAPRPHN